MGQHVSIRTGTAKWIPTLHELYDLSADPMETENRAGTRPELENRLRTDLQRWMKGWRPSAPLAETTEIDGALEDRLRSLGYVE